MGTSTGRPTILIVEADGGERELLGDVLEASGLDVILCSGPTAPDFTCIGSRDGSCPLIDAADVIVLDLWLESDTVLAGTPGSELLELYRASGRPVVALSRQGGAIDAIVDEDVIHLERWPDPDSVVAAVDRLCRRRPGP
jgi:CheY-like chemotaxis protein